MLANKMFITHHTSAANAPHFSKKHSPTHRSVNIWGLASGYEHYGRFVNTGIAGDSLEALHSE